MGDRMQSRKIFVGETSRNFFPPLLRWNRKSSGFFLGILGQKFQGRLVYAFIELGSELAIVASSIDSCCWIHERLDRNGMVSG